MNKRSVKTCIVQVAVAKINKIVLKSLFRAKAESTVSGRVSVAEQRTAFGARVAKQARITASVCRRTRTETK